MPVRAVKFTQMEARRFTRSDEEIRDFRVETNSTITMVQERGPREVHVEFRFSVNYGPHGIITFGGLVVFEGEQARAIGAGWRANHNLPNETAGEIHTAILRLGVLESVTIARNLELPPPFPLPSVSFNDKAAPGAPVAVPAAASDPSFA